MHVAEVTVERVFSRSGRRSLRYPYWTEVGFEALEVKYHSCEIAGGMTLPEGRHLAVALRAEGDWSRIYGWCDTGVRTVCVPNPWVGIVPLSLVLLAAVVVSAPLTLAVIEHRDATMLAPIGIFYAVLLVYALMTVGHRYQLQVAKYKLQAWLKENAA